MKRQSAITAFFRPVYMRIRDLETENESDVRSGSSIDNSTSDQASTLRNEEVARNVIALTNQISEESSNNIPTLSMPFDVNTLPNELSTREGRSLRNGLHILHGCIPTMMEHVIVQFISGLLKAIDFHENIKKEFKTVNGLK